MCLCFLPVYSGHQVRWMYQPGSHRRKVTQDFSSTFLLRCMLLFFSREGCSRSFPSSNVKSNFVCQRLNRSPLVGRFYFFRPFEYQSTSNTEHVEASNKQYFTDPSFGTHLYTDSESSSTLRRRPRSNKDCFHGSLFPDHSRALQLLTLTEAVLPLPQ